MNPIDECTSASNLEWLDYALELRRGGCPTGIKRSFHVIHARRMLAVHDAQRLATFAIL